VSGSNGWIDLIPPHWVRKKLKYVASLKSGESITSDEIAESGPYPVFGGNGFRGYTTEYTHCGIMSSLGVKEHCVETSTTPPDVSGHQSTLSL
jgi:hypothetical protein